MQIVYHCYGGTHSSPVAAAIHVGLLPEDRIPRPAELMAIPLFDRQPHGCFGRLWEVGRDLRGHRVCVMGRGPAGPHALAALQSGYALAGGRPEALMLVDTLGCANLWMRLGGYLSRQLGLVGIGRPLVIWGTQRAYPQLVALVQTVRQELVSREGSSLP